MADRPRRSSRRNKTDSGDDEPAVVILRSRTTNHADTAAANGCSSDSISERTTSGRRSTRARRGQTRRRDVTWCPVGRKESAKDRSA